MAKKKASSKIKTTKKSNKKVIEASNNVSNALAQLKKMEYLSKETPTQ